MATNALSASAADAAILAQVAALRGTIRSHKDRAMHLWKKCAPNDLSLEDGKRALGRYTQQLLKGDAYAEPAD